MKKTFTLLVSVLLLSACTQKPAVPAQSTPAPTAKPSKKSSIILMPKVPSLPGWKKLEEKTLKISFQLPAGLANQRLSDTLLTSKDPEKGTVVCFKISDRKTAVKTDTAATGCDGDGKSTFVIAANSTDYTSAGREAGILDSTGYALTNGQHFLTGAANSLESYGLVLHEYKNPNAMQFLVIEDPRKSRDGSSPVPPYTYIEAVVKNPTDPVYPTFVIKMKWSDTYSQVTFNKMLSTLGYSQ
ncbi:MAG TPA: hypothetical protein VLH19_02050 [Patescibacteria group bacterium]|nr:hypothetical protein [Patescibacteria group bacterium]